MAKRRLIRNTPVSSASSEKKSQTAAEDGSGESVPDQSTTRRSSRIKEVTADNEAQKQNKSSGVEETKKEEEVVTTPEKNTRKLRKPQTDSQKQDKSSGAEETKKEEEVTPTEKSTRKLRRPLANAASAEKEAQAEVKTEEIEDIPPEVKQLATSPVKSTRQSRRSNVKAPCQDDDNKVASQEDDSKVQEESTEAKQEVTEKKPVRLTRKANANNTAVKNEEKTEAEVPKVEEIASEVEQDNITTKSIDTPNSACANDVSVKTNDKIQDEVMEVEKAPEVEEKITPVKATRQSRRGKANMSEEDKQLPDDSSETVADSLEDSQQRTSPAVKSPRQTRKVNVKSQGSSPAKASDESDVGTEVKETGRRRMIKRTAKAQPPVSVCEDSSAKVAGDGDKQTSQGPLDCEISNEDTAGDIQKTENIQEHTEKICTGNSEAVLENSHAAEENSCTKEKVSKEMAETPLEVVPTDTVESCDKGIDIEMEDKSLGDNQETKSSTEALTKGDIDEEENSQDGDGFMVMDEELDYEYQEENSMEEPIAEKEEEQHRGKEKKIDAASEQKAADTSELKDSEIEGKDEVAMEVAEATCKSGKDVSEESNDKNDSASDDKDEELDYEVNNEEDDDDDGVSLAPDELVIMEEDPEYMSLFADEVDEQKEKSSDQKTKRERVSRWDGGRDSRERERKDDRSRSDKDRKSYRPKDDERRSREKTDDRSSRSRDSRKRDKSRRSSDRERSDQSHRASSRVSIFTLIHLWTN